MSEHQCAAPISGAGIPYKDNSEPELMRVRELAMQHDAACEANPLAFPCCRERNHVGLDLLFDWDPLTGSTEGMGQDVAMLAFKIRRLAKERADLELQMARELLAEVKALRSRVDPKEPA